MIPPDVLNRKSLFSLLYKIDQDLAERTRENGCPFAGGRCIAPITGESLGAVLLTLKRHLRFASACAAVVPGVGAVCCRHRCGSGAAGFTGRRCCFWSVPSVRDNPHRSLLSDLRLFAGSGVQQSTVGNATFEAFFSRAPDTGNYPGA